MALRFRDVDGSEITIEQVDERMENPWHIDDDLASYRICTMWMPMSQDDGRLFETTIWADWNSKNSRELLTMPAASEPEAREHHRDAVNHVRAFVDGNVDLAAVFDYINGHREDLPPLPGDPT